MQLDILIKFGLNGVNPVETPVLLLNAEDFEQEGNAKGETVVAEEGSLVVCVSQLLATAYDMVHLTSCDGGDQSVEVLQWCHILVVVSEAFVCGNHLAHVVVGVFTLLLHQIHRCIEHLHSFERFAADSKIIRHVLEGELVKELWQILQEVLVVFERRILDHPDETESITNLTHALPNGLQVVLTLSQVLQVGSELKGPLVRIFTLELLLVAIKALSLLLKHVLDGVVEKERAAEVRKLLAEELVQLSHHWIQNANSVGANRVQHLIDANGAHLLSFLRLLYKHLLMKVVTIVTHKDLRLLEQVHDIDALVKLLCRQMRWHDGDTELILR